VRSVLINGVCILLLLLMLFRLQDLQQQRCQAWHNVNHMYHVPGHWAAHSGEGHPTIVKCRDAATLIASHTVGCGLRVW
jgi:hypothetical protein